MSNLTTPSARFWQGKRVLITGHTGFKGSWLALWLEKLGATVYGLALPPETNPNLFTLAALEKSIKTTYLDIRKLNETADLLKTIKPQIVFHLAAQSLVRRSYTEPVNTYEVNVMGTVNILEACRHVADVRAAVIVTSDKCYENKEWCWAYREIDPLGGYDPYSSSKGCAELVTAAWRNSFFSEGNQSTNIASARAGNVFGGGDWAEDRLIPDAMRALTEQRAIPIRNPQAIRPWQHVLEPLSGYIILAEKLYQQDGQYAQSWNFGPDEHAARSVSWVASEIVNIWGKGASWEGVSKDEAHEACALKVDSSKARSLLGWQPRLSLPEALHWTVDWYRRVAAREKARELILEQIESYEHKT